MPLFPCSECGGVVSTLAAACPHCGARVDANDRDTKSFDEPPPLPAPSRESPPTKLQLPRKSHETLLGKWLKEGMIGLGALLILLVICWLLGIDMSDLRLVGGPRGPRFIPKKPEHSSFTSSTAHSFFDSQVPMTWTWNIEFGYFQHDIVLVNTTPMRALKDVKLTVSLMVEGKVQSLVLKADAIEMGRKHVWSNVVTAPKASIDLAASTASLQAVEVPSIFDPESILKH